MQNETEFRQQISLVANKLQLDEFVIEKDYFVTKVIGVINSINDDNYDLIFQGGTSLAKAYRIIERMSEDCDYRIRFKGLDKISKEKSRKILRQFRRMLVEKLTDEGFTIPKDEIRVRNEGQFMNIKVHYNSMYPISQGIKPFIALEFFLGTVKKDPIIEPVTTLIKNVLDDKVSYDEFLVPCLAVIETAAEKWVGLTRRVATSKYREYYKDPHLVRHLYDLYKINKDGYLTKEFPELVGQILITDRLQFKNHNEDYFKNPISEIKRAITELHKSEEWHKNWGIFSDTMIYEKNKPSYNEVMDNFIKISDVVIKDIKKLF